MDGYTSTLSELAVSALKNVCLLLKIPTSACACICVVKTLVVQSAMHCSTLMCLCTVSSLGGVLFAVFCAPLAMVLPSVYIHDELVLWTHQRAQRYGGDT
jgi:hypothetical protein